MSYLKPTLAPLAVDLNAASCCTPLATVNLGRVVIGGSCIVPGRQGVITPGGVCVTTDQGASVCLGG